MAIKLTNNEFLDVYSNTSKEFKANAGDSIIAGHTFEMEIGCVSSMENQFKIDKLENKLSRSQGSFLNDGFRVGQTCALYIVNNTNGVTESFTSMTISNITDLVLTISGLPNRNNWSTGIDYTAVLLSNATYDSVNFAFNFVDNEVPKDSTPSLESLIDQETSKFVADGINALSVGGTITMTQIGKKSGQFSTSAIITRLTDVSNPYTAFTSTRKRFRIDTNFTFPAMFDPNSFIGDKCLKYYSKASFKINSNDNLAPTVIEYKENASTGLWNEGFNTEAPNATSSTGVSPLYYNEANQFIVSFTTPTSKNITQFELGGMYLTVDDDFNKNKSESQETYLPTLKTGLIGSANIGDDWVSSTTHPFNLAMDNYTQVDSGGVRTHTLYLRLNPFYANPNGFGKFMEGRGDLDRNFLLWVKAGNTNRLLFDGQLEYKALIGQAFTALTKGTVNHDNNSDYKDLSITNNAFNDDYNLEDDIAFISEFKLRSADVNESVTCKIIAYDLVSSEIVLNKIVFDISNIDLQYFINQTTPVSNNLPDSSRKKEAFLYKKTSLTAGEMQVRLYYPFIIDWRYWEEVLSTHPFFVSQNKNNSNWFNYNVLPWRLYIKTEINRNGVVDYNYHELPFLNYDDWAGTSTIQLFDETETTEYKILQENKKMLIKATHVFPSNYSDFPWGMITIEPKENSPRYIMSTEIDKTQVNNPLTGIANPKRCDIQFLTADTIVLRCYVDTNLLNGNDFCITSKISEDGKLNNNPEDVKITEAGEDKLIELGTETKITD